MHGGGLSVQTLIIASISSLAAAILIHEFWQAGSLLAATVTPIIVALVSEGLRRPADRISDIRRGRAAPVTRPDPNQPDPFGIWGEQPRRSRRGPAIAIATGLVAFVIAGIALTGTELVFGGSAGGGDRRTTLLGGQDRDQPRERTQTQTQTQTVQQTVTTDTESQTVTTPPATTTTEAAPTTTAPVPTTATAPAPAPVEP
jgi:hypothetical protein